MGKGYKRKTRWRTLNIADCSLAPPTNETNDDATHKGRENGHNVTRSNGQTSRKSVHSKSDSRNDNGIVNGDSANTSRSRSQPKFIFNENEYTRITTPRQDVLFKKGYLARKKVWSGNNASTSATPSTTESQSASHSTADGSETTEDQQLLDYRDNGIECYSTPTESTTEMSYGTFYDYTSGYYYEYPMMLMGPPIPGPPIHNILTAMPCQAVPLRPIQWVNPAFVPKLDHPYCLVDYQNSQVDQQYAMPLDENEMAVPTEHMTGNEESVEITNGNTNQTESGVSEEQPVNGDERCDQHNENESEEVHNNENYEPAVDSNLPNEPTLETVLAQQLHVSHHLLPPVPQSYMYPGHYMFGPALVNVNGMTVQNGQMIRTNEVNVTKSAFAQLRWKKKMRQKKARRPIFQDNIGDYGPEEEDYSSGAENVNIQMCVNDITTFTTNSTIASRPLNPNCKEFEFKVTNIEFENTTSLSDSVITPTSVLNGEENINKSQSSEVMQLHNHTGSLHKSASAQDVNQAATETPAVVTNVEYADEAMPIESHHTNGYCEMHETEIGVDVTCAEFKDIVEKIEENCSKPPLENNLMDMVIVTEYDRLPNETNDECDKGENQRLINHENLTKNNASKNKYKDGVNLICDTTSGIKLDEEYSCTSKPNIRMHINGVSMGVDAIRAQMNADASNEDSGFESQTRSSDRPITDAVTQWIRRANSPELFITTMLNTNNMVETDTEDDELDDSELSKNLQGNPMPALSANSIVNDVNIMSSRTAICGEFAMNNNCSQNNVVLTMKKKKRRSRNGRKRTIKSVGGISMTETRTNADDKFNRRRQQKKSHATTRLKPKSLIEYQHNICEFPENDSDAGMRVATNTRIYLDKILSLINTDKGRIEYCEDMKQKQIEVDVDQVKTFEQGEIVVSFDGKLLPTNIYKGIQLICKQEEIMGDQLINLSEKNSIGKIEELDMLECWEAETIELTNQNKRFKDRELYKSDEIDGEFNHTKVDTMSLELVRKYYTLSRESVENYSSIGDLLGDANQGDIQPQSVLIIPQRIIETLYSEKISSLVKPNDILNKELYVDEGIEVYESCYTGQIPPILITPNLYRSYSFHDEDGPVPCKAACCMIQ